MNGKQHRTEALRPVRDDDEAWIAASRQALDAGVDELDAATLSRLNRARQLALDAARKPRAPRWLWGAAFATAASCALAVLVLKDPALPPPLPGDDTLAASDLDLLATDGELALYEDLEFYAWLDAQQSADG
jgi:hypothetical protein